VPYPENFVVRLIICVVGLVAVWMAAQYVGDVFLRHEPFSISAFDIVMPIGLGIVEAFVWKPKQR